MELLTELFGLRTGSVFRVLNTGLGLGAAVNGRVVSYFSGRLLTTTEDNRM